MSATTITEVRPSPATVHWGYQDDALRPIASVPDGGVLRVRTVQGRPTDPVPAAWIADDVLEINASHIERGPGSHIITGPVEIPGARPGDVIGIDVMDVRFGAPYGINRIRPGGGIFPAALPDGSEPDVVAIPIDAETATGTVPPGIGIPLRPFFGIIATGPPPEWGRVSSVEPRANGGNMDCKELTAGSRLFLPVFVPGAKLSVGDGHGAQGDGEVDQTAVETCLEGDLRVWIQPGLELTGPLAVTPTGVIAMGVAPTLDEAARLAVAHLLSLLEEHCGVPWRDGYRLASLVVDLRITQVVNRVMGVHAVLPHAVLAQLDAPGWLRLDRAPDRPVASR